MPIVSGNDIADGVYIATTPIRVNRNRYLAGLLIQISTVEGSKACNVIYAEGLTLHGWYYEDGFKKNYQFGNYSDETIAQHINSALGTSFVGVSPTTLSDDEVTTDLIIGKIAPIEGNSGLNNLNYIEDELTDI